MGSSQSRFDRFAARTADMVAHGGFFTFCVLTIVVWAPTMLFLDINTSQLIINTVTTIITFLLVALLHNDQQRFEEATNKRLEEIIAALPGRADPVSDEAQKP